MAPVEFLGFRDLVARWNYTRQGVYKLMRIAEFPAPAFTINGGMTKVWRMLDVVEFERGRPELRSEVMKRRKVIGFYRAVGK